MEPLAAELGAEITAPLNVEAPGELESLFDSIRSRWGKLHVEYACAYLASGFARRITAGTIYVDGGANIVA